MQKHTQLLIIIGVSLRLVIVYTWYLRIFLKIVKTQNTQIKRYCSVLDRRILFRETSWKVNVLESMLFQVEDRVCQDKIFNVLYFLFPYKLLYNIFLLLIKSFYCIQHLIESIDISNFRQNNSNNDNSYNNNNRYMKY